MLFFVLFLMLLGSVQSFPYENGPDSVPAILGDITWVGNVTDGGPNVTFTGQNLHDIESQIAAIQPGFSWNTTWFAKNTMPMNPKINTHLEKRVEGDFYCNVGGVTYATTDPLEEGIQYLHGIPGDCHLGPGPALCSRVSCSYDTAIFYCNDNSYDIYVPCSTLGDRASDIWLACFQAPYFVRGQVFDTDNWNVAVGGLSNNQGC
ncbi:hypothetical protein BX600DRAFT_496930 [Xylariales sp. PMI_506]|nr:hypothetical protein BX600DRAFT_496930 [Xylariales sp. PMI_506]